MFGHLYSIFSRLELVDLYFLKTGTCRFGVTCKYNHLRDKHVLGLPILKEEKSCPYYMRTGACKYGFACKFNHPQPAAVGSLPPVTGNGSFGSIVSRGRSFASTLFRAALV
ncbi:hypothetical protein MKX01_011841 [Papaver californicum]|nr:hypothetical protein MKX01_011841 [Papaver californicum]